MPLRRFPLLPLAAALATACSSSDIHVTTPPLTPTGPDQVLSRLASARDERVPAYRRNAFGPAWTDTDHNGCDTRNDVLARDLTSVTFRPGTHDCVVVAGHLADPYSSRDLTFVKAQPAVEVDHVVSLGNAWRSGASRWPYAKLLAFANDPLELLTVSGVLNRAKSDSDAAAWLPPAGACPYVARQVSVKEKYGLTVTDAERAAISVVLRRCPGTALPRGGNPTAATNRSARPAATRTGRG